MPHLPSGRTDPQGSSKSLILSFMHLPFSGPVGRRDGCLQVQVARSTRAGQVQTECEEATDSELRRKLS